MNWEALSVVGMLTVVSGAILLLPGLWWARKKAREHIDAPAGMSLTATGIGLAVLFTIILVGGFSAQFWAVDTLFGQWMATPFGRLAFVFAVVAVAFITERLLKWVGLEMTALRPRNDV